MNEWDEKPHFAASKLGLDTKERFTCLSALVVWRRRKSYIYGALCWEISHKLTHSSLITLRTLRLRSYVTHSK